MFFVIEPGQAGNLALTHHVVCGILGLIKTKFGLGSILCHTVIDSEILLPKWWAT